MLLHKHVCPVMKALVTTRHFNKKFFTEMGTLLVPDI